MKATENDILKLKIKNLENRLGIMEQAFTFHAGTYYNINLTENVIPGFMYQCIDGEYYNINERIGFPENASFTDVVNYWSYQIPEDEKETYLSFLNIENLINRYKNGETHVSLKYWLRNSLFKDMYIQQHIVMYTDLITSDICAITYLVNLTEQYNKEEMQKQKLKRTYKELEEALDQAKSANKAKDIFFSNMSHNIRTPLNAIMGYTKLALECNDDRERSNDYFEHVMKSTEYMLFMLDNIMMLTQFDSGLVQIEETPCSTENFVKENMQCCRNMIENCNQHLEDSFDIKTPYLFYDVPKTRAIIVNLLSNAMKYTPEGGTITIKTEELPSDKEGCIQIRTTVSDNGIGISKEFMPKIYDRFSREHESVSGNPIPGLGIGMAVVKSIVDLKHGSIDITSKEGMGTTVVVTLTYRIAGSDDLEWDLAAGEYDFTGKRILLAEDNELNAEIATELLKVFGFEIDVACDGAICVDMLSRAPDYYYDAILMDILMPNMNGFEATRMIRSMQNPAKSSIPIIAITANVVEHDKKQALAEGMNDYTEKPINMKKLLGALARVIK